MFSMAERRIEAGLSQEALAHRAKVSFRTINRYERGHVAPSEKYAKRILRALKIPVDQWKELRP